MTLQALQTIAKSKRINIEHYDVVFAFINEKYTFIYVTFANKQVCGGNACFLNRETFKINVQSIYKREEIHEDYITNGFEYIANIKK